MTQQQSYLAPKLTLLIIGIFLLQLIPGFTSLFLLERSLAWQEPWRFISSIFLHGGIAHLLYNGFALAFFGTLLEHYIRRERFLIVFFVAGIGANLIAVRFYSASLGASGAIYGILGALMIVRPWQTVPAFGVPMPVIVAGLAWAFGDIAGLFNPASSTGHIAHLSGMVIGALLGVRWRIKMPRKKKKQVIFNEEDLRRWEDTYIKPKK